MYKAVKISGFINNIGNIGNIRRNIHNIHNIHNINNMVRKPKCLVAKSHFINLIGDTPGDVKKVASEIEHIAKTMGHTVKVISIVPDISKSPEWKDELNRMMWLGSNASVIINKLVNVEYSKITDLTRSVEDFGYGHSRQSLTIKIDSGNYDNYNNSSNSLINKFDQIYPISESMARKIKYIKPFIE